MIIIALDFTVKNLPRAAEHDAGSALRDAVLHFCGMPDGSYEFATHENGKPYVKNSDVTYSVSHTDGCVGCAVSIDAEMLETPLLPSIVTAPGIYKFDAEYPCEIGFDVEIVDRQRSHERISAISAKFFSPGERVRLDASPDRAFEFYHVWTAKESYVKCTGEGMKAIAQSDTSSADESLLIRQFKIIRDDAEYSASICLMKKDRNTK